jgi:aminocarboxymuconate-semialdehyde decarboxylase
MRAVITDIHCHFVPERYFAFIEADPAFAARRTRRGDDRVEVTVGSVSFGMNETFFDPQRQIERMDRLGIERSVLSLATPLIDYAVPGPIAAAAARIFNDELAALIAAHGDRFAGWAFLPMQDPAAAAAELRRAVTELGLWGGHMGSNVNGRYLDAAQYAPIFDAARMLDVPLFVHPANPPGRDRTADYELTIVSGYLFDSTLNIFNMIFGGLLDRYPDLRLCVAHAGGYGLLLRKRMQREVDTNPELARRIKGSVGDYLRRLWFDTVCFEEGYLRYAIDVAQLGHFVLGSDGPFPLGEPDPVGFIRASFGTDAVGQAILHHNAEALFGPRHQ